MKNRRSIQEAMRPQHGPCLHLSSCRGEIRHAAERSFLATAYLDSPFISMRLVIPTWDSLCLIIKSDLGLEGINTNQATRLVKNTIMQTLDCISTPYERRPLFE